MHNSREIDYIIVGQGLAGSTLSYQLIKEGKNILVIDEGNPHTSSKIAGGLYNPVTGRKMVKTWKADLLFPYLINFYKEMEQLCSSRFLVDIPIYRPFISMEEQNEWMGKSSTIEYAPYIKKVHCKSLYSFANDPFGGIELLQSGYLDIPIFLESFRDYLSSNEQLDDSQFESDSLIVEKSFVRYKGTKARRIIFCDGLNSVKQGHFQWLPFSPVKGEVLRIKSDFKLNNILNRGVFVVPLENGLFRVGSNYDNHDLTSVPTEKARAEITGRLSDLANISYDIVEQVAGIRPATRDRRPFLGLHPDYETIGVFNGLGTKGVSLAPYFSNHLMRFLEYGEELSSEVNINRYFSLYYDSLKN
ncbi:FAD-binding oxidoreductase [Fulvivirga sp. 29W222]|uniref:FAD-binding oxidoreductase n=1 Tax=Fulvivirga marina TaxID=2494733 RepID=A0A937KAR5_9BACT|nr:FAD-dependent oxidoreductase [Fulvivirga marina]MBL6444932.1 FAD-binding oxidoreductase [Fulvivirga marina]